MTAFVMRDEWKDEPESITGTEYVEPSVTELIKPGQRIAHLFPRSVMDDYVLQRVTNRVWRVSRHFYGSHVGRWGVLLFDPAGGYHQSPTVNNIVNSWRGTGRDLRRDCVT